MPKVCVFDVNETLLDLGALDPHFEEVFGDPSVRRAWFSQLLQSALVATVTDAYSDFSTLGASALQMTAKRLGVEISGEDQRLILGAIKELPPHPEVAQALDLLQGAGIRLAALTNSTQEVAEAQLDSAGLSKSFEQILSADSVKRLKPAAAPYRMAAQSLGVETGEVRLVAAHAWDVGGAQRAGCAAAFVARPGMVLDPQIPSPEVVGSDLLEVGDRVIELEKRVDR